MGKLLKTTAHNLPYQKVKSVQVKIITGNVKAQLSTYNRLEESIESIKEHFGMKRSKKLFSIYRSRQLDPA